MSVQRSNNQKQAQQAQGRQSSNANRASQGKSSNKAGRASQQQQPSNEQSEFVSKNQNQRSAQPSSQRRK